MSSMPAASSALTPRLRRLGGAGNDARPHRPAGGAAVEERARRTGGGRMSAGRARRGPACCSSRAPVPSISCPPAFGVAQGASVGLSFRDRPGPARPVRGDAETAQRHRAQKPFPARTPHTITKLAPLLAEIQAAVLKRGGAISDQEMELWHACALAAPVTSGNHEIVAAISGHAPPQRASAPPICATISLPVLLGLRKALRHSSRRISERHPAHRSVASFLPLRSASVYTVGSNSGCVRLTELSDVQRELADRL